jgi:predicted Zn-dependent peptidase
MDSVRSVAYELRLPGGIVSDPAEGVGTSLLLAELLIRGAGSMSAQEISSAFEQKGISHGESVAQDYYSLHGSCLVESFSEALSLLARILCEPTLPEAEISDISALLLQEIKAIKDNPMRLAIQELNARFYPQPYNRPLAGTEEGVSCASAREVVRSLWERHFVPEGALLSVAGNISVQEVERLVSARLGSWQGKAVHRPSFSSFHDRQRFHVQQNAAQLQICFAYPSASYCDRLYYAARVAAGILSGGMFGRLFIEVREKRGLCYSVAARHVATNDYGSVLVYAGTTPERAQETLDVAMRVVENFVDDLDELELARSKVNLKASIVIGSESSASRAATNSNDWWILGRIRPQSEIEEAIDTVSPQMLADFCETYPAKNATLLTLGSRDLKERS